jgi:DNA-binding FadR family transcriptional regulator
MGATTKKAGGKRQWSESKAAGKKRPRPDRAAADSTSTSSSSSTNKKPVKGLNHIRGHAAVVATCDSGKEKQATKELLTLLEESASELHPEQAAGKQ